MVKELDVMITDYILVLESLVLAFLIFRQSDKSSLKTNAFYLFLSLALSSLLGGTYHGFFTINQISGLIIWKLSMISIGLVALFSWRLASDLILNKKYGRLVYRLSTIEFAAYALYVIFVDHSFRIAIINYLPSTIFLLSAFVVSYIKSRNTALLLGVFGLVLTFIAAWIQQAQISLHPLYFNYNSLYHLVQAVALAVIFFAIRKWTSK